MAPALFSYELLQQVVVVSVTGLITMLVIIALRKKYLRNKMKKSGRRELDPTSYAIQLLQENNFTMTMFGFQFADSQRLTMKDVQHLAEELSKSYINFRSCIMNIHGNCYLEETDTPFNVNQFVNYIKLDLEMDDTNSAQDIDECIIQHAVNYVNKHSLINVKWNDYDRPNWDMFYLHYPQHNRCFLFFRCNHVLCDGIFASTCIALLQFHLWGHNMTGKRKAFRDLDSHDIGKLLKEVFGQPSMKKPWWYSIYMLATLVPSFISVARALMGMKPDPVCSVNGKVSSWTGIKEWALGPPISISEFKKIAHAHGGTVNDFFLLLCSKAIRAYMQLQNDTSNIVEINAAGVKSTRDLVALKDEFMNFCVHGAKANELVGILYSLPIQTCSMDVIKSRFAKIKYGLSGWWTIQGLRLLSLFPKFVIEEFYIKGTAAATTLITSNLIASKKPWPLPPSKDTSAQDEYVKWVFGQSTSGSANVNFTVLTYNDHIRLGVTAEIGSVSDTKLLMNCFMDQYRFIA